MTDQPAALKHYFYHGFEYDTADEMAAFLHAHPEEIAPYTASAYRLADGMGAWGDYRGMRGVLNMLVDVRVALAKLRGEKHLE